MILKETLKLFSIAMRDDVTLRYPLYLSLSSVFLASLLTCLDELCLRHLIFIPPLPRAVYYDARGHGRSHRLRLEKWTTLLIKYEKQFLFTFLPAIPPSSSSSYPFYIPCPRHFNDSLSRAHPATHLENRKLDETRRYSDISLPVSELLCSLLVRWIFHYGTRWKLPRARLLPMGFLKLRATLAVALSLFHPLTTYNANPLESSTRLFHLMTLPRTQVA